MVGVEKAVGSFISVEIAPRRHVPVMGAHCGMCLMKFVTVGLLAGIAPVQALRQTKALIVIRGP
jgi:hypothetical protein